jgi:hypothetical protein
VGMGFSGLGLLARQLVEKYLSLFPAREETGG